MREDIKRRIEQIRRGEVPEGYVRRANDVAPKDWNAIELSNIVKVSKRKVNPARTHKDFLCIELEHIEEGTGRLIGFTSSRLQSSIKNFFESGQILFGKLRPYLKKYYLANSEGVCSSEIWVLIPNGEVGTKFMYYLVQSNRFIRAANVSSGTKMPRADWDYMSSATFVMPKKGEQIRISEILSTCDRVIELKKKLVEEKIKVKKWFMQTLLTGMICVKDIENGTPFEELKKRIEQIRNGQIPEGYEKKRNVGIFPVDWELQRLVKYADKVVDGTHTTPKYVENGVPFYSVETITSNDFKNVKFISHEEHLRLSKRCKVEKGDILLTRIGTIGKTALVDWDEEGSIYVSLALIKISNENLRSYFYEYSKSSLFVKEVLRQSLLLATPPKINMNDIEKVKLVISSSGVERTRIAEILSTADKEIDLLNKDLKQWELKKKSLMQLLLTGIVRVSTEN
ncbi:MAG: restriction endonuclease subunit S [Mesotoga sp.]